MSGELSVQLLSEVLRFELGGQPGGPLELREVVNQAGNHLVSMHAWRWLEGRELRLRPRKSIALVGATWNEGAKQLSKTGAFTDYSPLSADVARVTRGTGARTGSYGVASRISADTIQLETSIGAAANGQTDIEATLPNDQIELPSDFDFQAIQAVGMTSGMAGLAELTSPETMLNLRQWSATGGGVGFWGLVRWIRANSGGGQAVPRLELWPPATSDDEQLVIFYRGGWIEPQDDDEVLCLPRGGWLNLLFIEVCKAIISGHEEPEKGSVDQRLAALELGVLFTKAKTRDGMIQADWGPLENGWTSADRMPLSRYDIPPEPITTIS